jgi:hypothetical protein
MTVAPESSFGLRIWISSPEVKFPGIEFTFFGVREFALRSRQPFKLWGRISGGIISMGFSADECPSVVAEDCRFQEMCEDSWGSDLKWGRENIFDESGFPRF